MRKNKKAAVALACLLLISLSFAGGLIYANAQKGHPTGADTSTAQPDHPADDQMGEVLATYSMRLWNDNTNEDSSIYSYLRQNSPQEPITVSFGYLSPQNISKNFIMKVFYNYQEVEFSLTSDPAAVQDHYSFAFEPRDAIEDTIDITFQLSDAVQDSADHAKLMVCFFISPEQHASEQQLTSNIYGNYMIYDLIYTDQARQQPFTPIIPAEAFQPLTQELDSEPLSEEEEFGTSLSGMFFVTNKVDPTHYDSSYEPIPFLLQTEKKQPLPLLFGFKHTIELPDETRLPTQQFVILPLVNWQQGTIDGKPYFAGEKAVNNHRIAFGRFSLDTPSEAGLYEIAFLVVPISQDFSRGVAEDTEIFTSERFTLEIS